MCMPTARVLLAEDDSQPRDNGIRSSGKVDRVATAKALQPAL